MRSNYKKALFLTMIFFLMFLLSACGSHNPEAVRKKIEDYLYKKYGEEFVVTRIGIRKDKGGEEYVARIYPKSIIGTSKEMDKYYYGSASVDKLSFGRLEKPGDNYGLIKINVGAEEYLLPKVKELFGNKILLKTDLKYKKQASNGFYAWYKEPSFIKALQDLKNNPTKTRIELELYLYIFDRIDNEQEKEERREEIFKFVQYLKREGLFKYLELGVIFIDERVLAPNYDSYKWKIEDSVLVKEEIEGETVKLPPMELRKEMSEVLQKEIDEMSEEELLAKMGEIRKSELSYKTMDKYNATHYGLIYSVGILKVKYRTSYQKHKKNNTLEHYYYKNKSDVRIGKNLEYIYEN